MSLAITEIWLQSTKKLAKTYTFKSDEINFKQAFQKALSCLETIETTSISKTFEIAFERALRDAED